jgi:hypothetical protein
MDIAACPPNYFRVFSNEESFKRLISLQHRKASEGFGLVKVPHTYTSGSPTSRRVPVKSGVFFSSQKFAK